jgi:DNA repair exonuclease SbcCD ATPase subunit
MSESKDLAVVEQPQQLITIEPAKYVELVFEPFAKRLANAKSLADAATFDVTTTAGMAVAVKHRATFRDIRVASEKARKERKAPILEIGKLLDSRQKEIEAEIAPFESRFDDAIKAEEKRKDDEKIAKARAESERITAIRKRIAEIQAVPALLVGKPSRTIATAIDGLDELTITLEGFAEFSGEAEMAKMATLDKLREMLTAQQAHEAEQARLAAEREQLERERAEAAERDRQAAAARAEQERKDREAREAEERRQRAEREAHEAELRRQREAEEARLAEQRAELQRQQDEINRQRAEAERVERERQEAIAAEERRKQEDKEAAQRLESDHAEALIENARRDAEAAERAAELERARRARVDFERNGPGDAEIVKTLAAHYDVTVGDVMGWMKNFDYSAADEQLAAENVAAN